MDLFSLRFFAPPVLSLIFIFLAQPNLLNSSYLINATDPVLAAAGMFIVMSGFLISSVAMFLVNIFSLDVITFSKDEIVHLGELFPYMKGDLPRSNNAKELAEWLLLDQAGGEYVRSQIQGRWNYFMISFNTYLSLLFVVLPAIAFLDVTPSLLWWSLYAFFVVIMYYNAHAFFKNVNDITRFLVRKAGLRAE